MSIYKVYSIILLAFFCPTSFADQPDISVTHQLLSAGVSNGNSDIELVFFVTNNSSFDISNITASFSDESIGHSTFSIDGIGLASEKKVKVNISTPTDISFFRFGSPLSLNLSVEETSGQTWYQPVVSEGAN